MTAKELNEYRRSIGLDAESFGSLVGVTRQAVIWWETGERKIPKPIAKLVALLKKFPQLKEEL